MKIMFVWRKMDNMAGGVERMITTLIHEMAARGHDVSLFTWDRDTAASFYPLDPAVTWHKLNMGSPDDKAGFVQRLKRFPAVRRIVRVDNPDVIICFESGVFFSMRIFLFGFRQPVVGAERNSPDRLKQMPSRFREWLTYALLIPADKVVVQFPRYISAYPFFLRRKMTAIHNPVKPALAMAAPAGSEKDEKILLCVGRLVYQKNIDVLVRAFAKLSPEFPLWKLNIAGGGDDQEKIQSLILHENLSDKINLLGDVKNVEPLYAGAHLFCLPSRYEGFPNALAEAMAHGLPGVGFAGCWGVSDLIEDGRSGLLAEGNGNVHALTESLRRLMGNDDLRARMGAAAAQSIKAYAPETIFATWEQFFKECIRYAPVCALRR